MLLDRIEMTVTNTHDTKATSFLIERFMVPEDIESIELYLKVPIRTWKLTLIYDSCYNLRAEILPEGRRHRIRIHRDIALTSKGTKAGPIPAGEWIIAMEIDKRQIMNEATGMIEILGTPMDEIA